MTQIYLFYFIVQTHETKKPLIFQGASPQPMNYRQIPKRDTQTNIYQTRFTRPIPAKGLYVGSSKGVQGPPKPLRSNRIAFSALW